MHAKRNRSDEGEERLTEIVIVIVGSNEKRDACSRSTVGCSCRCSLCVRDSRAACSGSWRREEEEEEEGELGCCCIVGRDMNRDERKRSEEEEVGHNRLVVVHSVVVAGVAVGEDGEDSKRIVAVGVAVRIAARTHIRSLFLHYHFFPTLAILFLSAHHFRLRLSVHLSLSVFSRSVNFSAACPFCLHPAHATSAVELENANVLFDCQRRHETERDEDHGLCTIQRRGEERKLKVKIENQKRKIRN